MVPGIPGTRVLGYSGSGLLGRKFASLFSFSSQKPLVSQFCTGGVPGVPASWGLKTQTRAAPATRVWISGILDTSIECAEILNLYHCEICTGTERQLRAGTRRLYGAVLLVFPRTAVMGPPNAFVPEL
eukprot:783794-Rhodomonas_salina.1